MTPCIAWLLFQTLIGTVKSHPHGVSYHGRPKVSNPHRYGKKLRVARRGQNHHHVSNPHRYGKKPSLRTSLSAGKRRFQTLIGTVKRMVELEEAEFAIVFQTLIGTVKSSTSIPPGQALTTFQTLIGTVKSGGRSPQGGDPAGEVSNPHRYGKKHFLPDLSGSPNHVSNPHRYGKKHFLKKRRH